MVESYRTVLEGGICEITEKKSRFIATVLAVQTEEAAMEFIEQIKKKYWDANHNCFAYVIGTKDEITRCSDDGEPAKTAGKPILDVISGEKLHNVLVVVTRYFGGTLLGTGGLVRAYQSAAKEGLAKSTLLDKIYGVKSELITDYSGIGKIQYILSQMDITVLNSEYTDNVTLQLLVPFFATSELEKKLAEVTNGKVRLSHSANVYFAKVSGNILIFDT